ncbi:hypothetical protein A9Q81_21945 [Gammaproteobacteria bacterium 42_54_T18]|nr:hypothetical protein A9Q81_21945 [Gammaproteobacteria bacterium 42_54_T18]
MKSLPNRFEQALEKFVVEMRALPFPFDHCTWEDWNWGDSIRFARWGYRKSKITVSTDLLSVEQIDIAKAYCVYLRVDDLIHVNDISKKLVVIRLLFSILKERKVSITTIDHQIYERHIATIGKEYSGHTRVAFLAYTNLFLQTLNARGCLSKQIKLRQVFRDAGLSNSTLPHKIAQRKLPSEKVILATGHIFSQVMSISGEPLDYLDNAMDRMICCNMALSLAAPERVAEIQILTKQKLTEQVSENNGEREIFHFIHWRGSKGTQDFPKLIHQAMVPTIQRVLEYYSDVCEPARILARYYENPQDPLSHLLGSYIVDDLHGLNLDKSVTLWQLGGLLGFYDEMDNKRVLRGIQGFPFVPEPGYVVKGVGVATKSALLGVNVRKNELPLALQVTDLTLAEIEGHWVSWVTSNIEHFPYRQHANGKRVRLSDALLVYTGKQLVTTGSGYRLGKSPFAIESLNLGDAFSKRLHDRHSGTSIFRKYGFDGEEYQLTSHQFRHFINTQAQRGGMSETILAAWSGRASVAQNVVYDHRSDDEKHAAIAEIYEPEREIIVIPVDEVEFELKTGKTASKMSTGYCIQSLYINPCTRLNNCVGCTKSCHVKGDDKALALIEADLKVQEARLSEVFQLLSDQNRIANDWFRLHTENANRYRALIEVLTDPKVEEGAVVRFTGEAYKLRVTNANVTESIEYTPLLMDQSSPVSPKKITGEQAQGENDPLAALNALIDNMVEDNESPIDSSLDDIQQFLEG